MCSNWDSGEWSDFAAPDRAWRGNALGTTNANVPPTDTAAMPCQVARRPRPRPSTNMHGVAMQVPPATTNPKNVRSVLTSEEVALSKAASLSSSGTSDSMPSSTAMLERASRCSKGALCRSNRNAAYEARVRKTGAQVTGYFLKIFFNRSQTM